MRVQRCKGTRDLSPPEMQRFRLIEGLFRDRCLKSGYEEIRTPTIEYLHLFTATGTLTPGTLGRVYSFLDWDGWSGERVVLRPDGTIPVARAYIDTMADRELAKLFYVANIFSFEETGKETRERWQCGAELIGAGSCLADVELITLALDVLAALGLKDVRLSLSHAGLIRALLAASGLSPKEQTSMFDRILDGDKATLAALTAQLSAPGASLRPLLDLKGKSPGFLKNIKALLGRDLSDFEPALDDFIEIASLLETLGHTFEIDIASGKGFEYYTGIMFQVFAAEERVAGGGRYDDLIPLMGGPAMPASGFALYVDRIMGLISPQVLNDHLPERVLVRSQAGQTDAVREAFRAAALLREAGYAAELQLGNAHPSNPRWTLDVRDQAPRFVLTDGASGARHEAAAAEEVISLLGGGVDH